MNDIKTTAESFTNFYYARVDDVATRTDLKPLYNETSMMTWEGTAIMGQANILEKLSSMPKLRHQGLAIDVQPSSLQVPNLLVSVNGQLLVDDGPPMQFHQVFQLIYVQNSDIPYYIQNDIFRLVLA